MVDPLSALGLLVAFAPFGDKLVKLLELWEKARIRPDNIASSYFRELADAFSKVHAELAKKEVPRIDGTRLNMLLQSFAEKTANVKGQKVPPSLDGTLAAAAEGAKLLDAWALDRIELDEPQRARLLEEIERVAGTCMALAALLKRDI